MSEISSNFSSLGNISNAGISARNNNPTKSPVTDSLFKDQLQALQNPMPATPTPKAVAPALLKFSNHAIDRMQARGVRFSPEEMSRIESAVGKAEAKGAKNTLLLTDSAAMIVSIKDKTVVTVMDKTNLKENVFTNIDSTVVI